MSMNISLRKKLFKGKKNPVITRILIRPEWRLHLAHIGSIFYQSSIADLVYILIDDRSPHISTSIIDDFIDDILWLNLRNIEIVTISEFYEQLLHCANWFIDHNETHLEKILIKSSDEKRIKKYYLHEIEIPKVKKYFSYHNLTKPRDDYVIQLKDGRRICGCCGSLMKNNNEKDLPPLSTIAASSAAAAAAAAATAAAAAAAAIAAATSSVVTVNSDTNEGDSNDETSRSETSESENVNDFLITEENLLKTSLNELSDCSKLRIRTNEIPSTILMNFYLESKVCDFNLGFCLPVIDALLGVTTLIEHSSPLISEETHIFNRKIFNLLGKKYPTYDKHLSYKLVHYRYHSASILELIKLGELDGYNDSRLMTVKNLKKRGFPPDILKEFARIGDAKGIIDPQQLPDICKAYFHKDTNVIKYTGILEPLRIMIDNFPLNLTRYYTNPFTKEMMPLRKLLWVDQAEIKKDVTTFMLKGTNNYIRLTERIALNADGNNQWKQNYLNTYYKGELLTGPVSSTSTSATSIGSVVGANAAAAAAAAAAGGVAFTSELAIPSTTMPTSQKFIFLPWMSCDPIENPFKVKFCFYPEYYTGYEKPKQIKKVDGLLNSKPPAEGIIVVQNYGFFHYNGNDELHLLCAFPRGKNYQL